MPQKIKTQHQRAVLRGIFIVLFGLSVVLIIYERVRVSEQLALEQGQTPVAARRTVQGAATQGTSYIDQYRSAVIDTMRMISPLMEAGIITWHEQQDLKNQYDRLLDTRSPEVYQDLHLRLTVLMRELIDQPPINQSAKNRHYSLLEDYPWLARLNQ